MDNSNNTIINNPSINHKDCYVAYIELIGYYDTILRSWDCRKLEEVYNILFSMSNLGKSAKDFPLSYGSIKPVGEKNSARKRIFVYIMAGSIVLAIEDNGIDSLYFLLDFCYYIQNILFDYDDNAKVLVRGGVSKGVFFGKNSIAFGKGFVNAYQLAKEAIYPRIIIDRQLPIIDNEALRSQFDFCRVLVDFDYQYIDWICSQDRTAEDIKAYCLKSIDNSSNPKEQVLYRWIMSKLNLGFD